MRKEFSYTTPEGYFDELRTRLGRIPAVLQAQEEENAQSQPAAQQPVFEPQPRERRPVFARLAPYLALAATFLVAVVIGNFILSRSTRQDVVSSSDEEIIEYLIESGTTVSQIEEYLSYNNNTNDQ